MIFFFEFHDLATRCSLKLSRMLTSSGSNAWPVSQQSFNETPFSVFADASNTIRYLVVSRSGLITT